MKLPEDWAGLLGASLFVLATLVRSFDISHTLDLALSLIGAIMWIVEGRRINSRSNIWLNSFCIFMIVSGALFTFFF